MEYTPGEWNIYPSAVNERHSSIWCEGHYIGTIYDKANAERIVKAVNCHDDLYEALKAMNKYLETGYPQNMRLKEIAVVLLDKAMAKAKGK